MPSVAILALPHCLMSGVIGPLEIFAIANSLNKRDVPVFHPVEVVGVTEETATNFTGITLPVHRKMDEAEPDIIILPPVFVALEQLLANHHIIDWLRLRHKAGAVIATVCSGAFFLAEAGLVDDLTATTHWKLAEQFQERYPNVELQPEMMLIDGGQYICAGGVMAWQDLALHLVARFIDAEIASKCAKIMVMDGTRHVQTPYFMFDQHQADEHADVPIHTVQKWMQGNYAIHATLEELAQHAGMGVRTFLRRFKRATGQTPHNYLQQLRIEAARHLLEISTKNIEEITGLTGYTDSSSFRRLFKEKTGLTPKEYRARFNRLI